MIESAGAGLTVLGERNAPCIRASERASVRVAGQTSEACCDRSWSARPGQVPKCYLVGSDRRLPFAQLPPPAIDNAVPRARNSDSGEAPESREAKNLSFPGKLHVDVTLGPRSNSPSVQADTEIGNLRRREILNSCATSSPPLFPDPRE